MKVASRILITFFAFAFAVIYAMPSLALMFGVALAVYSKYVSLFFCFVFAWNVAKMVESAYRRMNESKSIDESSGKTDRETEWLHGPGFSYTVKDDKITFTFRDIQDTEGRELSRLKFFREKFFKDK